MLYPALAQIAILFATGYLVFAAVWRKKNAVNLALILGVFFLGLLELGTLLQLSGVHGNILLRRIANIGVAGLAPSWFLFSIIFARQNARARISSWRKDVFYVLCLFPLIAAALPAQFLSVAIPQNEPMLITPVTLAWNGALVAAFILILVQLESILANSTHAARWHIKYVLVGSGVIAATQVLLISQTILGKAIDPSLLAIRPATTIIAITLFVFTHVRRDDSVSIYISPRLAYKSLVLFSVGLYLMLLALFHGRQASPLGFMSPSLFIVVVFLGGILLLVVLLSERASRTIRGFIQTHFYTDRYDYRQEWMKFTARISLCKNSADLHHAILFSYCDTFGLVGATLLLPSRGRDAFQDASRIEMDPLECAVPADASLPALLLEERSPMDADALEKRGGDELAELIARHRLSGALPLLSEENLAGIILLGPAITAGDVFTKEDIDLMTALASQSHTALQNLQLAEELSQAKELEVFGKISASLTHDLKNHVQSLGLILANAKNYIHDPEFQEDMLDSLSTVHSKMIRLIETLRQVPRRSYLELAPHSLKELAHEVRRTLPGANIRIHGQDVAAMADRGELAKVLTNLLLNAVEASKDSGQPPIEVGVTTENGKAVIRVQDQGCGMDQEFIARHLFKPFSSTKGTGLGIGLYQCREIVANHGGRLEVASTPGAGSTFSVHLPLAKLPEAEPKSDIPARTTP
ncbi:XrtA/PEP-CTERM system histidine kinase PrsK [Oceanidesulfovibrio marinus]|uniref:histidine kinase n=1 Tax=Oceanidesulfovibrio marinus TaxID=370038 RepID=A0A6P1ZAJ3_9BACT|nr:XrtA/PEP-CTERM system histidine kinase PrsK [Oceanidesulfovibrio marinus]TVM30587.1 PEP-CTERM system histidine kinase PrsK [Oceanidesulfovibrio marinus]